MGVTLKLVAAASGVSIGTVDRVMHGREGVKEETRLLVEKVAAELGYKSNIIGKALVAQRNPLKIGVIINAREYNYFAKEVWRGVEAGEAEIESFGVCVTYYPMDDFNEENQLRLLEQAGSHGLDGLIMKPINSPRLKSALDDLVTGGIPVITCTSDIVASKRLCFVGHDHMHEGRLLGSLLSKVIPPKARIGVIAGSVRILGHRRKAEGFHLAVMERRPDARFLGVFETNHDFNAAVSIVEALKGKGGVDALCVQSMDKEGMRNICRLFCGEKRPLICSFGTGEVLSELIGQGLVDFAIEENPYQQGYAAIKMMFKVLFNGFTPMAQFYEVPVNIVIDESYSRI